MRRIGFVIKLQSQICFHNAPVILSRKFALKNLPLGLHTNMATSVGSTDIYVGMREAAETAFVLSSSNQDISWAILWCENMLPGVARLKLQHRISNSAAI